MQRHKSKGICSAENEKECSHNEYRQFDIYLPTQSDLTMNKEKAKKSRNSRGGKSAEKSKDVREHEDDVDEEEGEKF